MEIVEVNIDPFQSSILLKEHQVQAFRFHEPIRPTISNNTIVMLIDQKVYIQSIKALAFLLSLKYIRKNDKKQGKKLLKRVLVSYL